MSVQPWIPNRRRAEVPSAKDIAVETEVPAPQELKEVVPPNKFQRLVPFLIVVAVVGMLGIFFASGIRRITSPYMLMFPLMFVMGAVGMIGGHGNSGGPGTDEINGIRRMFLEALTELRGKVHDRASAQYDFLAHFAPPPQTLAAMVGGPRMWERSKPTDDPEHFLAPRAGVAKQLLGAGMRMGDTANEKQLEPVSRVFAERFLRTHRAVAGLPALIDLKTHRSVQFFGPGDLDGVIRAMLLQVAVLHPPNLVLIAVITNNPASWDWIKWLPHNQHPQRVDALGTERMVYTPQAAPAALAEILADRGDFNPDDKFTGSTKPWLIVVADQVGTVDSCGEGSEAVTVLRRGGVEEAELALQGARVRVDADGGARKRRMGPDDALKYWLSKADTVDAEAARQVACRMARWRASTDKAARAAKTEDVESDKSWAALHGAGDLGTMGTTLWRNYPEGSRERMNVPIGWDKSGAPVSINIKEEAEQGMGSHGLILGYTGSGKSTLLVNLLLGLVARHTPEQLNLVLVDYKGDSTFDGFEKLSHTVEIISNLGSLDMITRLEAVLLGEVERRQRLRSEGGLATVGHKLRSAREYLKARERRTDLPEPFPALVVVVDEFTALLKNHPDFKEVFEQLARLGRSDRICLLLATQSLTGISLGQLESNLGWKIAMKTAKADESSAVLGSKDAYFLEQPGEGYLKIGGADPKYFRGANIEELYFPPDVIAEGPQRRAYGGVSGVAPFGVEAVPIPGQADEDEDATAEPVQRSREEINSAPEVGQVVLKQLAGKGSQCRKLWLPPLTHPRPVGQLVGASNPQPGDKARLNLPIGVIDKPWFHAQDVYSVDLTDTNLALLGRPRSGKSVALQTIALAAAKLNSPRRVQIYGLDFGPDGALLALEGLPHVGGVAMRGDIDAVSRVIAEAQEVITRRSALFRELRIGSMSAYRAAVAANPELDDGFGDVLVLLDGWDAFKEDFEDPIKTGGTVTPNQVAALVNTGLAVGVHVVMSLQVYSTLGRAMTQSFNARIDFKLNQPELSGVQNKKLAETIPGDVPGRALDLATHLHIMIGAPRLDDIEAVDDAGLRAAVAEIGAQWTQEKARDVRVLPERLDAAELLLPPDWDGSPWAAPIGLYEKNLSPVVLDFIADRHLTVYGRKNCGKTHLLASVMRSLMNRFSPEQIQFIVVDLKSSRLLDAIDEDYILKWTGGEVIDNPAYPSSDGSEKPKITRAVPRNGVILSTSELTAAMVEVAASLEKRSPTGALSAAERRQRSWWQGPEIFLLVDDYGMVHNAAPTAFAPLAKYWGNAPQLGIHSIVACPISLATRIISAAGSLPKQNNDAGGATLVMDGIRSEGPVIGVRVDPRPPGRGVLVNNEGQGVIQTPVVLDLEGKTNANAADLWETDPN